MNNLSEKLEDLVKQDTMKYMYGAKETLFAKTGINQLNTESIRKKHQEAFKSIMKSNYIQKYFNLLGKNEKTLDIHTLDAKITNKILENIDRTKYIVFK